MSTSRLMGSLYYYYYYYYYYYIIPSLLCFEVHDIFSVVVKPKLKINERNRKIQIWTQSPATALPPTATIGNQTSVEVNFTLRWFSTEHLHFMNHTIRFVFLGKTNITDRIDGEASKRVMEDWNHWMAVILITCCKPSFRSVLKRGAVTVRNVPMTLTRNSQDGPSD